MRIINLRYQLDLYRQKVLVIIGIWACLALLSYDAYAQRGKSINLPLYDERDLHFGFQLGAMMSNINLGYSNTFVRPPDSTIFITPLPNFGFSLGFIVSFRLSEEHWNLRLLPNVSFYERMVRFDYPNQSIIRSYENTFVEVPVLLKYKSIRRGNSRMYLVGGLTAGFKVAGEKQRLDEEQILTIDQNLELSYGFGLDYYMDFFKFAPELRFSHGVPNVFTPVNNPFARSIGSVTTHRVTLYLNFE